MALDFLFLLSALAGLLAGAAAVFLLLTRRARAPKRMPVGRHD